MRVLRAVFYSGQTSGGETEGLRPAGMQKETEQEAQRRWLSRNEGYFRGRYEEVKAWRLRKKTQTSGAMIQDEIPRSKPIRKYVLLIPEDKTGMIQDEIILRRLNGITFAAHGG